MSSEQAELLADSLENLERLEQDLLHFEDALVGGSENSDLVHTMFRYAHSLKGALLVLHHEDLAEVIHSIENILDKLRHGESIAGIELAIELSLQGLTLVAEGLDGGAPEAESLLGVSAGLQELLGAGGATTVVVRQATQQELTALRAVVPSMRYLYEIQKIISAELTQDEFEALPIFADLETNGHLMSFTPSFADIDRSRDDFVLRMLFATNVVPDDLELLIFDPMTLLHEEPSSVSDRQFPMMDVPVKHAEPRERSVQLAHRVLIVEDEFVSRKVVRSFLGAAGEINVVSTGAEAIEVFRAACAEKEFFTLICLDQKLADEVTGNVVLSEIRRIEAEYSRAGEPRVKVVMVTGDRNTDNVIDAFQSGADGYIVKPIDQKKFADLLIRLGINL